MTTSPKDVADLVRGVNTINETTEDQRLRAYRGVDVAARASHRPAHDPGSRTGGSYPGEAS